MMSKFNPLIKFYLAAFSNKISQRTELNYSIEQL